LYYILKIACHLYCVLKKAGHKKAEKRQKKAGKRQQKGGKNAAKKIAKNAEKNCGKKGGKTVYSWTGPAAVLKPVWNRSETGLKPVLLILLLQHSYRIMVHIILQKRTTKSWGHFHQHFTRSFYTHISQKRTKELTTRLNFYAFGICVGKSFA